MTDSTPSSQSQSNPSSRPPASDPSPQPSDEEIIAALIGTESRGIESTDDRVAAIIDDLVGGNESGTRSGREQ